MQIAPVRFIDRKRFYDLLKSLAYFVPSRWRSEFIGSKRFFVLFFFFFFALGPSKTIFPRFTARASRVMFSHGITLRYCKPNRFRAPTCFGFNRFYLFALTRHFYFFRRKLLGNKVTILCTYVQNITCDHRPVLHAVRFRSNLLFHLLFLFYLTLF